MSEYHRRMNWPHDRCDNRLASENDWQFEEEWHRTDDAINTPEKPCTSEADQVKETPEES